MLIEPSESQLESVAKERLLLINSNHPQDDRNIEEETEIILFPFVGPIDFTLYFNQLSHSKRVFQKDTHLHFQKEDNQIIEASAFNAADQEIK